MTLLNLWAKITGADKRKHSPNQQAVILGAAADYTIVTPYGLYCDLPADTLAVQLKDDALLGVTQTRPDDAARGEPTFFHPPTNTRIIARASGDIDIIVGNASGNVNVTTSAEVNVTAATATVNAETTINGDLTVNGNAVVNGDFENSGAASLGGPGGQPIARQGDATNGSTIIVGSGQHTAT